MGTLALIKRSANGLTLDFTIDNSVIGAAVTGVVLLLIFVIATMIVTGLWANVTNRGKQAGFGNMIKSGYGWVIVTVIFYEIFGANWLSRLVDWLQGL